MEKPVFTQKQLKGTIRGKKGNKQTLKNVLVNPYVHYWPLIKGKDEALIHKTLQKNLPMMRVAKTSVPWKEIKAIPKEQRKEFRMKYTSPEFEPPDELTRVSLIFGVNEVTKLLEQDKANSVLVTEDVKPKLMVTHVVNLAVLHNVPILIVPELRGLLKRCTGIGSAVIALARGLTVDSSLFQMNKVIRNVYKNYPVPTNHMNFNRSKSSAFFNECESSDSNKECGDIKENQQGETKFASGIEDCYLYRKSKSERVFIPSGSAKRDLKCHAMDYINLISENKRARKLEKYKPLVVNRIRSNKDRNQKKVAMLKQRKKL